MAGARVEITVDNTLVSRALTRALDLLGGPGLKLMLEDIGEGLLISTRDRAAAEKGPDGRDWVELSPGYAAWKQNARPGVPMLKFDNHMLGDRLSWQIEGSSLLLGTNAEYGAVQQLGSPDGSGQNIPARPFLGVSNDDAKEIVAIVQDHLEDALRWR